MDKLEYIPRDLVSVYVGIKKYIVEVIGTENENEALLYQIKFPNGEIQYADKDNIVPIPLTPEILEKNGWKSIYWAYRQGYYCGKKDAGKLAGDHRLLKAMRLTKKWKSRKIRNEANKMLKKNPLKPRELQRSVLRLKRYGCSKA